MKKTVVLLVLLAGMWQGAAGQFQLLWYKQVPNVPYTIQNVNFSHNSQWLLCGTGGEFNIIYDAATGSIVKDSLPKMDYPFFSPDDSHIYGRKANRIAYYNISTGIDESNFIPAPKNLGATDMSKDGNYIGSMTDDGFYVWNTATGKIVKTKIIPNDTVPQNDPHQWKLTKQQNLEILFSCDNSKIYTRTYYEYVRTNDKGQLEYSGNATDRIYDFNTLDSIGTIPNASWTFWLSNTCKYIAINANDNNNTIIKIYDLITWQMISTITAGSNSAYTLKFTSDDKYLVVAQGTGGENLSIWDVSTGKLILQEPGGDYQNIDISNDNNYLAISVGNDIDMVRFPILGITQPSELQEILYPNPANGELSLKITLPAPLFLMATLNDLNGAFIANVYQQYAEQGTNIIRIDVSPYSSGTYFLKLNAVGFEKIYKLIIVK